MSCKTRCGLLFNGLWIDSSNEYLFDFLVAHTNKWIVFSGARIGQGGHGHIAERTENDWKYEFVKRGMVFEESMTNDVRQVSDEKNINHKKNQI